MANVELREKYVAFFPLRFLRFNCQKFLQNKPTPSFYGTILVKEGSTDMITIKDKMIQVCEKKA